MASRVAVEEQAGPEPEDRESRLSSTRSLVVGIDATRGRRTWILTAAAVAAAIWFSACGDGGTEPLPVDPPRPTTVTIISDTLTFTTLGDTARLSTEVRDQYGQVMGVVVRWLSRNSGVAEVNSAGRVRAVGSGVTTIVAEARGIADARGVADSVAITVDAPSFTVSGTVGDPRRPGMVLPGVVVHLESWKRTYAVTDSDGRYRFPNVGGTVRVTAEAAFSYLSRTVEASVDADLTLDFDLEHTGVPPFRGTPWANRHILGPADSTSLTSVTFTGRGTRTVFDRRVNQWIPVYAYLFAAQFVERDVEFRVNPEFADVAAARAEVDKFALALGRLPAVFFSNLGAVAINAGVGAWGGSSYDGSIVIHVHDQTTPDAIRGRFLEEIFLHEAAHISLDPAHKDSPEWLAAQEADGVFISDYSRAHPGREDIAESILMYFAVRYHPRRLSPEDRWAILTAIPNRLAYFEEQGLDMSPYEATGSLLPGLAPGSVANSLHRTVLPAPEAAAVAGEVAVSPREEGTCEGEPEDPAQPWTAREYPQELLDGPCALPGIARNCARPHQLQGLFEAAGVDPGEASGHSVFLIGDNLDRSRGIAAPKVVDEAQAYGAVAVVDDGVAGGRARDHIPPVCG